MFRDVSIVQQIGVTVLAVATVAWAVGLVRVMRRDRTSPSSPLRSSRGGSIPGQQGPPRAETVELTADERAAFAGLVRQYGGQYGDGRS
ncbi:hypothetical protein [Streptomyces sp. NPDC003006]